MLLELNLITFAKSRYENEPWDSYLSISLQIQLINYIYLIIFVNLYIYLLFRSTKYK